MTSADAKVFWRLRVLYEFAFRKLFWVLRVLLGAACSFGALCVHFESTMLVF